MLAIALALSFTHGMRTGQRKLTQDDINAAVLKTMETQVLPSEYARAYENILPSVVRVVSYVKKSRLKDDRPKSHALARPKPLGPAAGTRDAADGDDEVEKGVGTGVVIVDKGVILTNLHVVQATATGRDLLRRPQAKPPWSGCSRKTIWRCSRPPRSPTI